MTNLEMILSECSNFLHNWEVWCLNFYDMKSHCDTKNISNYRMFRGLSTRPSKTISLLYYSATTITSVYGCVWVSIRPSVWQWWYNLRQSLSPGSCHYVWQQTQPWGFRTGTMRRFGFNNYTEKQYYQCIDIFVSFASNIIPLLYG